jgi:hypothetical protein
VVVAGWAAVVPCAWPSAGVLVVPESPVVDDEPSLEDDEPWDEDEEPFEEESSLVTPAPNRLLESLEPPPDEPFEPLAAPLLDFFLEPPLAWLRALWTGMLYSWPDGVFGSTCTPSDPPC